MNDLNKIPFGLRESDNELVDVYDVPNGKKCGCVCPSCSTPLESRQGEINVWHFAHSSKKVYEKTKKGCEYSFYLSLRLMARQLIGKQLRLCLPEYKGIIEYYEGIFRIPQTKEFIVTEKKEITLDDIEVESTFDGVAVDIVGTIDTFKFIIYFTHPDRSTPKELFNLKNTKCGVIEISLFSLHSKFLTAKDDGMTYHEILTDFLANNISSKSWVYHPNFKKYSESSLEEMKVNASDFRCSKISQNNHNHFTNTDPISSPIVEARETVTPTFSFQPYDTPSRDKEMDDFLKDYDHNKNQLHSDKLSKFTCRICNSQWSGVTNICPKCDTHLYSSEMLN